jgi:hypothetical protein
VGEEEGAARRNEDGDAAAPEAAAAPAEPAPASRAAATTQETSDWFAPRRAPKPAGDATPPGGTPTGPLSGRPPTPPQDPPPYAGGVPHEPRGHPQTPPAGFPAVGGPLGDRTGDPFAELLGKNPPPSPTGPTTGTPGDLPRAPAARPGTGGSPFDEPPAGSTLGLGTGRSPFADDGAPSGPVGPNGPERIAGDTLVSGIPRIPAEGRPGFPESVQVADDDGHDDEHDRFGGLDDPGPDDARPGRLRSRLVMAGVSLVAAAGVAYGAGLLLDHADVPNGTTVLGVDIGGKGRQEAVDALDAALGDRVTAPLTVVIDGRKEQLKPSVAGLTVDTEQTVRDASGRDYNPVSVIGSLFGGSREAVPAIEVDHDKLVAALNTVSAAAGAGGAAEDGMVKFVNGKAVAVPGKPHEGVDVRQAARSVEQAYRERAAGGGAAPIELPVSRQKPEIGEAQLQAAVDGFGKTAMSGWVWLKAGDVVVPFSQQTVSTFLTMKPGGGTLQPVIDTKKLAAAYGSSFDGVVIDGGAGTVKMTPQHAAAAMIQALKKPAPPSPQKRLAVVESAHST